jgi:hypothetical protein
MAVVSGHATSSPAARRGASGRATSGRLLEIGLAVYAAYHVALAALMISSPHVFFTSIGPFGTLNEHYIRDIATYNAALAIGLALAVRRPSWRVPVLAVVTLQFALHAINHLADIDRAHPAWTGYFDFFTLAASTALLAGLLRIAVARASARADEPRPSPRPPPSPRKGELP